MKNVLKNQITILALFVLFPIFTNAAISGNTNPIDGKKLIVENENIAIELEKRTFQIGDEIHYSLIKDKTQRIGIITGFEGDNVLIKSKSGMDLTIPLKTIETIQKGGKFLKKERNLKNALILTAVTMIASISGFLVSNNDESYGFTLIPVISLILLLLSIITLPILGLVYFFLKPKQRQNNPKFSKNQNWTMKIQ